MKNQPLVSIGIFTYNQEQYIAQTIESMLMQQCSFEFEILIGEDCGTDGTLEICQKYADKYPDKIKLFAREKNLGMLENFCDIVRKCQGKYIAFCAGDDYWIDEYKLQNQVDFLESNPDYALVHTNFKMFIQKENRFDDVVFKRDVGCVFQSYLKGNQIGALTVLVLRDVLLDGINQGFANKFLMEDYPLWLYIAQSHKIGYLDDVTAVYRVLPESMSNTQNEVKAAVFNNSVLGIRVYFAEKNNCINLILDDIVRAYKQQLNFGFENRHKELAVKAYDFLKKYNNVGFANYVKYIGVKFNLYKSADFILKIKNQIL